MWIVAGAIFGVVMAVVLEPGGGMVKMQVIIDMIWVIVCAALFFFMDTGLALLEAGLCCFGIKAVMGLRVSHE